MKYRKKPVVIEAIQFNNITEPTVYERIEEWSDGKVKRAYTEMYIDTLEGRMQVESGDWVIKGIKGEFYPCKPDIFEATYEAVK